MTVLPDDDRALTVTDPVCGAEFDLDDVRAREMHEGWMHFFCSVNCQKKFRSSPERYSRVPR